MGFEQWYDIPQQDSINAHTPKSLANFLWAPRSSAQFWSRQKLGIGRSVTHCLDETWWRELHGLGVAFKQLVSLLRSKDSDGGRLQQVPPVLGGQQLKSEQSEKR